MVIRRLQKEINGRERETRVKKKEVCNKNKGNERHAALENFFQLPNKALKTN